MIHAKLGDCFQYNGDGSRSYSTTKRSERNKRLNLIPGEFFSCVESSVTTDRKFLTEGGRTFYWSSGIMHDWHRLSPLELLARASE